MRFYSIKIKGALQYENITELEAARNKFVEEIKTFAASEFVKNDGRDFIFLTDIDSCYANLGAITKSPEEFEKYLKTLTELLGLPNAHISFSEIVLSNFTRLYRCASHRDFFENGDDIIETFGIFGFVDNDFSMPGESMIPEDISKENLYSNAKKHLFDETIFPELDRIYEKPSNGKIYGHPVHYLIRCDNRETRKAMHQTLLYALYDNKRIANRRYCFIDIYNSYRPHPTRENSKEYYEQLYNSCEGGALIIRYEDEFFDDGEFGSPSQNIIEDLCEFAEKYRNQVLTIFCIEKSSQKLADAFLSSCNNLSFIEIYETSATAENAQAYLERKAKECHVKPDKGLHLKAAENQRYTINELNAIFDKWYDKKLKSSVFPQYKSCADVKQTIKTSKPKGSAYTEFKNLIGLESAKKTVDMALNFYKAQKLFKDKNIKIERPAMHMIFTGNPGTAKTTVARLFANICKENNLLSVGNLYEVGRGDLVGQYVGHTAPLVQKIFKRAKGSVLFIDEAYSLVDDRNGLFGDEAINTIVQEMENNRDDLIVIFAGYPDKMEGFLNKNPGLRSRIAFHVNFDDYGTEELCSIARKISSGKGLSLTDDAMDKLKLLLSDATEQKDFGNGRFVRNVIEKAQMAQLDRLVKMDFEDVTEEAVKTITAEDIVMPEAIAQKHKNIKLGFCA